MSTRTPTRDTMHHEGVHVTSLILQLFARHLSQHLAYSSLRARVFIPKCAVLNTMSINWSARSGVSGNRSVSYTFKHTSPSKENSAASKIVRPPVHHLNSDPQLFCVISLFICMNVYTAADAKRDTHVLALLLGHPRYRDACCALRNIPHNLVLDICRREGLGARLARLKKLQEAQDELSALPRVLSRCLPSLRESFYEAWLLGSGDAWGLDVGVPETEKSARILSAFCISTLLLRPQELILFVVGNNLVQLMLPFLLTELGIARGDTVPPLIDPWNAVCTIQLPTSRMHLVNDFHFSEGVLNHFKPTLVVVCYPADAENFRVVLRTLRANNAIRTKVPALLAVGPHESCWLEAYKDVRVYRTPEAETPALAQVSCVWNIQQSILSWGTMAGLGLGILCGAFFRARPVLKRCESPK